MAKPDTDDGWLKYAHELDAALAVADFTKGARIVLREVFEQIFGPPKLKVATLSPSEIGGMVGMLRQNVARSIKELTDANALHRSTDGTEYRFNKNYETWTRGGVPRLTPEEIRYCRNAPRRAIARGHNSGLDARINLDNASKDAVLSELIQETGERINPDNESVSKLIRFPSPPKNPLLGRETKDKLASQPEPTGGPVGSFDDCIAYAAETWSCSLANHFTAKQEYLARQLDDRGDTGSGQPSPRWDCLIAAMEEMERRRSNEKAKPIDRPLEYVLTIAREYMLTGIPVPLVPLDPKPGKTQGPSLAVEQAKAEKLREILTKRNSTHGR